MLPSPTADACPGACELTIDTGSLRRLWLPSARSTQHHMEVLQKMRRGRKNREHDEALFEGAWALKQELKALVNQIRDRGGLLLLGGDYRVASSPCSRAAHEEGPCGETSPSVSLGHEQRDFVSSPAESSL